MTEELWGWHPWAHKQAHSHWCVHTRAHAHQATRVTMSPHCQLPGSAPASPSPTPHPPPPHRVQPSSSWPPPPILPVGAGGAPGASRLPRLSSHFADLPSVLSVPRVGAPSACRTEATWCCELRQVPDRDWLPAARSLTIKINRRFTEDG